MRRTRRPLLSTLVASASLAFRAHQTAESFSGPPSLKRPSVSLLRAPRTGSRSDPALASSDGDMTESVPNVSPGTLATLVEYATSFSAANGLQVESGSGGGSSVPGTRSYVTAPISLLPQAYPRDQFERATSLAGPFNLLVDRISRDGPFLKETHEDVRGVDEYTGKLLEMYEEVYLGERRGDGWGRFARSADRLGIQRSDYMLHEDSATGGHVIKQVELNTIASSFAGLASGVARLHSFETERLGDELRSFLEGNERAVTGKVSDDGDKGVPASPAMTALPAAISVAYDRYVERHAGAGAGSSKPVVVFVVQPGETNTVDQRLLEFALHDRHGIPVVRMSLAEVQERVTMDESTGRLSFDGEASRREIAVVYYRAGYAPTDYPSGYDTAGGTGVEWLGREKLERGACAKCPCLGYHLAGTKKVQQELARPGVVERFIDDGDDAAAIRSAFAGLYSLGADANEDDAGAVRDVLLRGGEGRYVLKPQREGGGNNYYGREMVDVLSANCTLTGDGDDAAVELSAGLGEFILMERLFPPQQLAVLLRNGRVEGSGMSISELGCFGTVVADGEGGVVHNEYGGFLLRTKFSGVDEGGVASGFATLSSPYLC
ncbi:hypothetical protein THAOC_04546 [Thalassiosira oceanica]|uniref:Glutathione synthetase n=1 Tax=Thalassiosira oceanica TaxID=159749 RepID=K0T4Y4_THAOC|nr:hypothetical protein THAOC_04546 [Thalassiosira oceanica]|eukprot:EJK73808.1 hypothetical protein THAOC_04546 [Thalassiosira oceanica]